LGSHLRAFAPDHLISPLSAVAAEDKFARDFERAWANNPHATINLKGEAIVWPPAAFALDDADVAKGPT
jgi:hypothetical protein